MTLENIKTISITTLNEDIFKKQGVIILSFYAMWCRPCLEMSDIIEDIARTYQDQVTIYKVNFDKFREVSRGFEVASLPTLIFFKDGKEKFRASGSQTKQQIEVILDMVKK